LPPVRFICFGEFSFSLFAEWNSFVEWMRAAAEQVVQHMLEPAAAFSRGWLLKELWWLIAEYSASIGMVSSCTEAVGAYLL
jgi:hypothetical protein